MRGEDAYYTMIYMSLIYESRIVYHVYSSFRNTIRKYGTRSLSGVGGCPVIGGGGRKIEFFQPYKVFEILFFLNINRRITKASHSRNTI
jgi:hypothetical protein